MVQNPSPLANRLLASLSKNEYQRLEPYLTSVQLSVGTVLQKPDETIATIYFPQTSVISLVNYLKNGSCTEVNLVGSTGMVGIPALLGGEYKNIHAVVQIAGHGCKISSRILKLEFQRGGELQNILHRYLLTRLEEISQLAVCNVHHKLEERLARWLLTVSDLTQSNYLPLTQELLANMLGVRRAGVTITAQTLKQAGMIEYHRGRIQILNQEALENTACECYQLFRDNYYY